MTTMIDEPEAPATVSEVVEIDGREHFETVVVGGDMPCIVDFWAPGCAPCGAMEHDFVEASKRFAGAVRFARVNVQANEEVAQIMRIRNVPTLVTFRGPAVYDIRAGRSSRKAIIRMAQRVLDKEQGIGLITRIKRFFQHF